MRSLTALVTALVLALGVGWVILGAAEGATVAAAAGAHPVPEATKTKKKTPKPTAAPTVASPEPSRRTPLDEEGDRWVQLAVVGGGSLLACVLVFFGLGALVRHRSRRDRDRDDFRTDEL